MSSPRHTRARTGAYRFSRLAFWCIRLMHDNALVHLFRNPHQILAGMGVRAGMQVLEVGCGSGFFTIPAAETVGPSGRLTALDVNPYAVEHVRQRLARHRIDNAEALHANVTHAGLPEQSYDLAFFIGVPRIAGGLGAVAKELRRILKPSGRIAFHAGRLSLTDLTKRLECEGFDLLEARGRVGFFAASTCAPARRGNAP